MPHAKIVGSGHYLLLGGDQRRSRAALPTSDEWIQQRSGIKERRYVEHSGIGPSDLRPPRLAMALEQARPRKTSTPSFSRR